MKRTYTEFYIHGYAVDASSKTMICTQCEFPQDLSYYKWSQLIPCGINDCTGRHFRSIVDPIPWSELNK